MKCRYEKLRNLTPTVNRTIGQGNSVKRKSIIILMVLMLGAVSCQAGKDDLDLRFNGQPVAAGTIVSLLHGTTGMIGVASNVAEPYTDTNGLYIRLLPGDGQAVMTNDGVVKHPACDPSACGVWVYAPPGDDVCWFDNPNGAIQAGLQFEVPMVSIATGAVTCQLYYYYVEWAIEVVAEFQIDIVGGQAATDPIPVNGTPDVACSLELNWQLQQDCSLYYLYLGTDRDAVAQATIDSAEYFGATHVALCNVDNLWPNTRYYWRVDANCGTVQQGDIWWFDTKNVPIGWWPFDEAAGDVAFDSSGRTNHGTLSSVARTTGIAGNALDFDGHGYVSLPVEFSTGLDQEVTVMFWQYGDPSTQPRDDTVFEGLDDQGCRVLGVHLPWGDGRVYWDAGNDGPAYDRISKAALAAEFKGCWNHWAFTKDVAAGEMSIYLNGRLWHSGQGKTYGIGTPAVFKIGSAADGADGYRGMIDDFRVYNRALDVDTIQAIHSEGEAVVVTVDPSRKLMVEGVSELDRKTYFNLHLAGLGGVSEDQINYLTDELDVHFGRGFLTNWAMTQCSEDALRPGYVDPCSVAALGRLLLHDIESNPLFQKQRLGDIVDSGVVDAWYPSQADIGNPNGYIPVTHDQIADFISLCLKHCYRDQTRPRYFEVMNEPFIQVDNLNTTWANMCDLHRTVAARIHEDFDSIMVGGIAQAWPEYYWNHFSYWNDSMGYFIDHVGAHMDFFSIHIYDGCYDEKIPLIRSGSNLEALLDLIENHSLLVSGQVKPLIISEYGTTIPLDSELGMNYSQYRDWYSIRGINSKLMALLDKPDRILKSIPFVVGTATWYDKPYPYPWVLFLPDGDEWVFSEFVKFYELWRDVRGCRLSIASSDPDIQVQAYGLGDRVFICLNNMVKANVKVRLDFVNDALPAIGSLAATRMYYENGGVVLLEDQLIDDEIVLRPEEGCVITVSLDAALQFYDMVDEHRYYTDQTVTAITTGEVVLGLEASLGTNPMVYASLRVGINREHGIEIIPTVTFNGHVLECPHDWPGDHQLGHDEFFGVLEYEVPIAYIETQNSVTISYAEPGGYVTSAVLSCAERVRGDINGDGVIDMIDFGDFAGCWLQKAGDSGWEPRCDLLPSPADTINGFDFAVLAANWLRGSR